jgi:hypothetical protein
MFVSYNNKLYLFVLDAKVLASKKVDLIDLDAKVLAS